MELMHLILAPILLSVILFILGIIIAVFITKRVLDKKNKDIDPNEIVVKNQDEL
ncbi:hypothetical protein [Bacillus sp. UMB0893]|uniref:hypothetical protein n=1 Tax=Bacillus sp. UMB0893 TaxID=2066053 RepID=UPI001C61006D|nr:hypothetical protein [Bacillus sp. UMB0893]